VSRSGSFSLAIDIHCWASQQWHPAEFNVR
jgi:hypothetical protein